MSQDYVERLSHSETFLRAQSYRETGFLVFDSSHSYFFQHSLVLHFLNSVCGIPSQWSVYISLSFYAILVALIGVFILKETYELVEDWNTGSSVIPPLVALSLVSFAYGERSELALPLMFLLLCYLFDAGFSNRRKSVIILLFVLGITFGSTTSIFVMIPFFFLFSFFRRRTGAIMYALIPLTYLIYAGYTYTLSLKRYSEFVWEGFLNFLGEIMRGGFPVRIVPWGRSTIPTMEDMYITSAAYVSLLALSVIIVFVAVFFWVKPPRKYNRNDENALFRAGLVATSLVLGIVLIAYIGASVNPEVPFSDIRTILIVSLTLLVPFLFLSRTLLKRINANKALLILLVSLMIVASLRTYYEVYPKSVHDPVNAVEDVRIAPLSVYYVGDFLRTFKTEGVITFDYKTGRASAYLSREHFQCSIFTSRLTPSTVVVFDINGLKLGSLYTATEAYAEAYNLILTQNVIYSNGNITIVQRK